MDDLVLHREPGAPVNYDESKIAQRLVTAEPKTHKTAAEFEAYRAETWAEIGTTPRPLRSVVFVRTEAPRRVSEGGIVLPTQVAGYYAGLPRGRFAYATVLVAGPDCHEVKEGDVVLFGRGYLARWRDEPMPDGTLVGWMDEDKIEGVVEG